MFIITILFLFIVFLFSFYFELIMTKTYYIPFFTLVSLYYLFFDGVIPLYAASYVPHLPFSNDLKGEAMVFTLAFVALQFTGYFLASRTFRFRPKAPVFSESMTALKLVSWTMMVGYFFIYFLIQKYPVPSLPQLKPACWYFAFSTLTFLLLRRQLSLTHTVAFVVAVIAKLTLDLLDGFLTPIIFDVFIIVAASMSLKLYRTLLISSFVCILLFGSYGYIKYFSKTIMHGKILHIAEFIPELSLHSLTASFNALARRSSHLLLTSHVIERTPNLVPFDERNPIGDALINHVPRVIWPSKPEERIGNTFGKRYEILNKDDMETSWNLPWTSDFYITFGPILSLFNIFVIGTVFGFCVRWLSSRPDKTFWFGVYSSTLLPLFYQASNFSLMTGSIFSVLIFLLVASWAAKAILPPRPTPPNPDMNSL